MRFARRAVMIALCSWGLLSCSVYRAARARLKGPYADRLVMDVSFLMGVREATDIAFHPDGRAVVTQKDGSVTVRHADGTTVALEHVFPNVDTESEKGLLGVVPDPEVAKNHIFYFYADDGPTEDKHRVYRAVLGKDDRLLVDFEHPIVGRARGTGPGLEGPRNHDGGGLSIYQGKLWIGVGDTGANATPPTNKYASCLNKGNGKILRVNLDGSVPDDNPLASYSEVTGCQGTDGGWELLPPDRRIVAWGLRNPWRFWIDPHTDLIWIGDVGELTREEISVGHTAEHYGYPFFEGNKDWSREGGALRLGKTCDQGFVPARPCTPAVYDYSHAEGTSVTGGLIPEGCGWSNAFDGKLFYLFADYGSNWLRALEVKADRSGVVSKQALGFGSFSGGPASIRQGLDGAVYIVFYGGGYVARLAPRDPSGSDCHAGGAVAPPVRSRSCGCRAAGKESGAGALGVLATLSLVLGQRARGRRRAQRQRRNSAS